MWRRYNPNPQGLMVGDCTVRAICAVTGREWRDVHRELCDLARDMADMPSSDRVWRELLRMNGFTWRKMIDRCPDCYTVGDFAEDHPSGIYVLGPHEHAVAVIEAEDEEGGESRRSMRSYEGGSRRSYEGGSYDGYSNRRGRSPTTGRYVSRDGGYSGHDGIEDIMEDVRDMPEAERRKLKQMLERM